MKGRILRSLAAVAATWLLGVGVAHAQAPVLAQPAVNGTAIGFNWTATAGAVQYRLQAGVSSGVYPVDIPLGNVTSFNLPGAPLGVFFVRIVAQTVAGDVPSNEAVIQVPSPPAAPTGLTVARNGTGLVAAWTPGVGGANADFFQIQIGLSPGTTIYSANVSNAGWGFPAGVPEGTYYVRAVAVNTQFGNTASAPSNEVAVTMPGSGACDAAVGDFSAAAFSGILSLNWTPIPGVANFMSVAIDNVPVVSELPISAPNGRMNFGYNQGNGTVLPQGTYDFAVRTVFSCGSTAVRNVRVVNTAAPPPGPRTPNPGAGELLPVPNYLRTVVERVAARRPDLLRNSCVEHGGNNRFMFEVVRDLRAIDNRWGLNIKRGREGLSQDIAEYNRSALPDEGATTDGRDDRRNVSLFDIIGGHCGNSPGPNWADVTGDTVRARTAAVWTLVYYLDAGYKP
jgi:hypothetical protein